MVPLVVDETVMGTPFRNVLVGKPLSTTVRPLTFGTEFVAEIVITFPLIAYPVTAPVLPTVPLAVDTAVEGRAVPSVMTPGA